MINELHEACNYPSEHCRRTRITVFPHKHPILGRNIIFFCNLRDAGGERALDDKVERGTSCLYSLVYWGAKE